jgi:putative DNA primase/helicase
MSHLEAPVVVWPRREVKGFDGLEEQLLTVPMHPVCDLREALEAKYETDAHFWPGHLHREGEEPPTTLPRINQRARPYIEGEGWSVRFSAVVLDIDDAEAHAAGMPHREEWWSEQAEKLSGWPHVLACGYYRTRGGYRLVARLPKPLLIEDYLNLLIALRHDLAKHGIVVDALKDWSRCYRLPFVRRDGAEQTFDADFSALNDTLNFNMPLSVAKTSLFSGIKHVNERYKAPDRITQNRNKELTRLAGSFRRSGLEEEEIFNSLWGVNVNRCDPPLEEEEVRNIARSAGTWAVGTARAVEYAPTVRTAEGDALMLPAEVIQNVHVPGVLVRPIRSALAQEAPRFTADSDAHIATHVLQDLEQDGHTLVFDRGFLWQYSKENGLWRQMPANLVQMVVAGYDQESILIGEKTKRFNANNARMEAVYHVVIKGRTVSGFFDDSASGLLFQNGLVLIENNAIALTQPKYEHKLTNCISTHYVENSPPVAFLKFLRECFRDDDDADDKIACLQEFVGNALLGQSTAYQKGLILFGTGANGKSTFQTIIESLFEGQSITSVPPQEFENEYRRAMLANSRLNLVNELPETDILLSESVKAMISGDSMVARQIREAPFQFRPRAGHIFAGNALPSVRDLTPGFFRRWLIIEWNRRFEKHEQDVGLARRIIRNERGAIAAWALEGALRAHSNGGYTEPHSSTTAIEEWRDTSDQVTSWLNARCIWPVVPDTNPRTSGEELYNNYKTWANLNGHATLSSVKFSRRLTSLDIPRYREKRGTNYGVELRRLAVLNGGKN